MHFLSISQLCDQCLNANFTKYQCLVIDNVKTLVMTGKRSSNNCYLWSLANTDHVCHLSKLDETTLWHKRLCHVSLNSIQKAYSKDVVIGLPPIRGYEKLIYEECQAGNRSRFLTSGSPRLQLLEYLN